MAIAASLITLVSGCFVLAEAIQSPKAKAPQCQVQQAVFDQIQQCPAGSDVYSSGKRVGKWTGVELKK